jgi:hypothetical protein
MRARLPGTLLTSVGALMLAAALGQPAWLASGQVGPGFVPQGMAALLALLGLAALLRPAAGIAGPRRTARPALFLLASVAGFALLLPLAGFLAASGLSGLLAALAAPGMRLRHAILVAAASMAGGAALFLGLLGLPLRALP